MIEWLKQLVGWQSDTRAPHERWPEVLHWQKGDYFEGVWNAQHTQGALVTVDRGGYAALKFCDNKFWVRIPRLLGRNQSLRNRQIDASLTESAEYMELLAEFNRAFGELEARDRRNGIKAA